jgi:hypothetical protein
VHLDDGVGVEPSQEAVVQGSRKRAPRRCGGPRGVAEDQLGGETIAVAAAVEGREEPRRVGRVGDSDGARKRTLKWKQRTAAVTAAAVAAAAVADLKQRLRICSGGS